MLYPTTRRLEIIQGLPWDETVQWLIGKPGIPVDVTGFTGLFAVRQRKQSTTAMLALTVGSGIEMAASGHINMSATDTQTAALPLGVFWYELEVQGTQLLRGDVEVIT